MSRLCGIRLGIWARKWCLRPRKPNLIAAAVTIGHGDPMFRPDVGAQWCRGVSDRRRPIHVPGSYLCHRTTLRA
jgi:hypothetical protein